ncbi:unnamed protein product [Effrenium voratum]|nr:unnamed protein product [Effrenium voratum]
MGVVEERLEDFFEKVGQAVGAHPVKSLLGSLVFVLGCCGGIAFLKSETRPEKQWVAQNAVALEHDAYVKATWPSNARFNLFAATCNDVDEDNCNILDPKYLKRFHEINQQIMDITIDGSALVGELNTQHKRSEGPWQRYTGNWSFMGAPSSVNGSVSFSGRKCFAFGPFCGKSSIMDVFRDDDYVVNNLDTAAVQRAVNFWEDQETLCPLSIAGADSPCFDSNCQKYKTPTEREDCRNLARSYCSSRCETETVERGGREVTFAKDLASCQDRGCIQLGNLGTATTTAAPAGQLNTDPGEAPESAFEFQPSKVKTMVGGLVKESGVYVRGKYLAGFYAVNKDELFCPREGSVDPVAEEWERRALCLMGIDADPRADPKLECVEDDLLKFHGLFQRSLSDEFGAAIRGDIVKLTLSYVVIIVYCAVMLGQMDAVHSGVALSFVTVLIVGLTIGSTMGLMGYFGVPNSNLNNNLYFLLLGLGVDDAFVLTSEYQRHRSKASLEGQVEMRRSSLPARQEPAASRCSSPLPPMPWPFWWAPAQCCRRWAGSAPTQVSLLCCAISSSLPFSSPALR